MEDNFDINIVRNRFLNKGLILLDDYKNAKTKVNCIDKDGYKVFITLDSISKQRKYRIFSKTNPYTLYNIQLWLDKKNSNITLLEKEYKSNHNPLKLECNFDKHIFYRRLMDLQKLSKCPICRNIKYINSNLEKDIQTALSKYNLKTSENITKHKQKIIFADCNGFLLKTSIYNLLTLKSIKKIKLNKDLIIPNTKLFLSLNFKNIELLSKECQDINQKLKFKCNTHNTYFEHSWKELKYLKHGGCQQCCNDFSKKRQRFTTEVIKEKINSFDKNIEVLSEYKNANSKIKIKCKIHNNIFEKTYADIYSGWALPCCKKRIGGKGGYNLALAERYKDEYINTDSELYIIRIFNEDESFYKIGITTKGINVRFSKGKIPYKYEVIDIFKSNLYSAIYLERKILEHNKKNKYKPKIKFCGYTECFLNIIKGDDF